MIVRHPKIHRLRFKGSLYEGHAEVDPKAIGLVLKKPGDAVIVDDPRGVVVALGRMWGKLSAAPVAPVAEPTKDDARGLPSEEELVKLLRDAEDWDRVANTPEEQTASGARIRSRARAAEMLLARKTTSPTAFAALEERVRKRSLHKDWMFHGFDGAMALRALILLHAPNAADVARFTLWRDDSALKPVIDPRWNNPRAWTDFRVKMVIFPALEKHPGAASEKLCRDYLALTAAETRPIVPPQFEKAPKALLAISPKTETALELLRHRRADVRGRAILDCLAHANERWARTALEKGVAYALAYIPD